MNVDYEHCGKTVLIEQPKKGNNDSVDDKEAVVDTDPAHVIWIEGESDFDRQDPVRDLRSVTKGILSEGMLLDDLVKAANSMPGGGENKNNDDGEGEQEGDGGNSVFSKVGAVASRLKKVDLGDLTSLVGIDKTYSTRELELAQSFLKGESLANHMEDSYYMAMGRAVGFNTTVGEEIVRV